MQMMDCVEVIVEKDMPGKAYTKECRVGSVMNKK